MSKAAIDGCSLSVSIARGMRSPPLRHGATSSASAAQLRAVWFGSEPPHPDERRRHQTGRARTATRGALTRPKAATSSRRRQEAIRDEAKLSRGQLMIARIRRPEDNAGSEHSAVARPRRHARRRRTRRSAARGVSERGDDAEVQEEELDQFTTSNPNSQSACFAAAPSVWDLGIGSWELNAVAARPISHERLSVRRRICPSETAAAQGVFAEIVLDGLRNRTRPHHVVTNLRW